MDKQRLRRRQAKASFATIIATLLVVLGIVFFGSKEVAANLKAAETVITATLTFLTAQIGAYYVSVQRTDERD